MHAPNQVSLAAKASGEPEFREIGVGPWEETHPGEPRPDNPAAADYDARFDTELLNDGDRRNVLDRYRYWSVQAIKDDLDARGRHDFEVAVENWTHDFNIGSMVRTANAFQAKRVHIVGPHKWNRKGALMTELYQHVEHHPSIAELVECWRNRIAGEIAAERARAAAAAIHIHEYGANASATGGQPLIPNPFGTSGTDGISPVQSAMAELADADNRIKELQSARIIALDIIPGAVPMETYRFPKRCLLLFGAEGPGLSRKALDLADDVVYISQFGSVRSINAGAAAAVAMHAWIAQHATIV
ncbi:RNA methyltransferase [Bifidobacterium cebidarum]|uniref:RNA methyltransferase n=1 Tax=Bifidobacterium cebidarum TaxID=2650773 RepID=A0A6I1GCW6_9BIFI|nr:TrmH family RNA methyltransferase [Bifidobacterium cebidarum]KAB7789493.1 RNA methyltransferase [Bifidobacterium cebidarum]